jgi:hypothetical protein
LLATASNAFRTLASLLKWHPVTRRALSISPYRSQIGHPNRRGFSDSPSGYRYPHVFAEAPWHLAVVSIVREVVLFLKLFEVLYILAVASQLEHKSKGMFESVSSPCL